MGVGSLLPDNNMDECNVALIGDAGVGKTSLVASAVFGTFQEVSAVNVKEKRCLLEGEMS